MPIKKRENRVSPRIELVYPIECKMCISKFNNKFLPPKITIIHIENISTEGIRFTSHLDFPVEANLELHFEFNFLGQRYNLFGNIVRKAYSSNTHFQYGVKFTKTSIGFIKTLHNLIA